MEEQGKKNEIGQLKLNWNGQLIELDAGYQTDSIGNPNCIRLVENEEDLKEGKNEINLLKASSPLLFLDLIKRAEQLKIPYALPGKTLLPGLAWQQGFYYPDSSKSIENEFQEKREALVANLRGILGLLVEREKLLVEMGKLKAASNLEAWQADAFLRAWGQLEFLAEEFGLDKQFTETFYLLLHDHALEIQGKILSLKS